jgi:hypothetical protein
MLPGPIDERTIHRIADQTEMLNNLNTFISFKGKSETYRVSLSFFIIYLSHLYRCLVKDACKIEKACCESTQVVCLAIIGSQTTTIWTDDTI